jgi:predicted  nucleic acid-binding Zn-ribbon protein
MAGPAVHPLDGAPASLRAFYDTASKEVQTYLAERLAKTPSKITRDENNRLKQQPEVGALKRQIEALRAQMENAAEQQNKVIEKLRTENERLTRANSTARTGKQPLVSNRSIRS